MHTLLCGKKTPDHKPLDHKRSKKDKRNNVELNNVESEAFRGALKANKIKYEASNCGYGLTHFEVFVNTSEIDILEGVLSTL